MCLGVRAREFVFGHSNARTNLHSLLIHLIFGDSQVARKLLGAVGTKGFVTFRRGPVQRAHKHTHGQKSLPNARAHMQTRTEGTLHLSVTWERWINRVKPFHTYHVLTGARSRNILSRASHVTQETTSFLP